MASSKESWFVKLAKEGCSKQYGSEKPPSVFDPDAAMALATIEPTMSAADEARKRFRPKVAEPTIQRGSANQTRPMYSSLGCYDVTHGAQKFRPLPTGKRRPPRTLAVLGRCDTVVRFR